MRIRFQVALLVLLSLSLLLPPGIGAVAGQSQTRPNIIVVFADDMDASPELLGTMSNLQQLFGQQGTNFTSAYVPVALCCPSRASLLTGQYLHNHDVVRNSGIHGGYAKFRTQGLEQKTVAIHLQNAGYRTALIGKYMNGYSEGVPQTYIPPGWSEWYGIINRVNYFNYIMNTNGVIVRHREQPEDYSTDVIAQHAFDFIRRSAQAQEAAPFFLLLTPYAPHGPATSAPRHAHLFADVQAPRPPSFNEADMSDKPTFLQDLPLLTDEQIAQIDSFYRDRLRSLQALDELLAGLVQVLTETGQLENTYLIFTADNGFEQGEHRIPHGKQTPYEESMRVPFFVRGPGVPAGATRQEPISTIDLAPTFAEIAGLDPLAIHQYDGRSLLPLWHPTDPPAPWRTAILFEQILISRNPLPTAALQGVTEQEDYDWEIDELHTMNAEEGGSGLGFSAYAGLRTLTHKYVEYRRGMFELYDLSQDPYETENLAAAVDPEMAAQLSAQLAALRTCAGPTCRSADTLPIAISTPTATPTITPTTMSTPMITLTITPTTTATLTPRPTATTTSTATAIPTASPAPTETTVPTQVASATATSASSPTTATPITLTTGTPSTTPPPAATPTPTVTVENGPPAQATLRLQVRVGRNEIISDEPLTIRLTEQSSGAQVDYQGVKNGTGWYVIDSLPTGDFLLTIVPPPGYQMNSPVLVSLVAGEAHEVTLNLSAVTATPTPEGNGEIGGAAGHRIYLPLVEQ